MTMGYCNSNKQAQGLIRVNFEALVEKAMTEKESGT
jgi:hypothetical protein